jgi:hypothetical protein
MVNKMNTKMQIGILKHLSAILGIFGLVSSIEIQAMAPKRNWEQAIDHAVIRYGLRTEPELKKFFKEAKVSYPPKDVAMLAFKKEKKLELWAKDDTNHWHFIHTYPLTASSGNLGPKLREHDRQIPEGVYQLTMFNPYSQMHLSMQINYPNTFDRILFTWKRFIRWLPGSR